MKIVGERERERQKGGERDTGRKIVKATEKQWERETESWLL